MWLNNGDNTVLTSPQGGSVLQWQHKDRFILGPSRIVDVGGELKRRGETHWCFPNYDEDKSLYYPYPRHGFVRNTTFSIDEKCENRAKFHAEIGKETPIFVIDTEVGITEETLRMQFSAVNQGQAQHHILLGLHPYFSVPVEGLALSLDGKVFFEVSQGKVGVTKVSRFFELNERKLVVHLNGIGDVLLIPGLPREPTHIFIWSDNPESYICVEPILGHPERFGSTGSPILNPGEDVHWTVRFQLT